MDDTKFWERGLCSQVGEQKRVDESKKHFTGRVNGTQWGEKVRTCFLNSFGSHERNLSLHGQSQSYIGQEVGNGIKSPHPRSSLPQRASENISFPLILPSSELACHSSPSFLPWEAFWKGNLYCWPYSLTSHILSNPLQSVIYLQSWWSLLVSHFQKSSDFSTQPYPTPPFGYILPLKLATFGFWANGCSQISFLHKDSLFLTCIFSSTCARFTQEPSLNPFFIFTLLAPLNSAQVSIFHFYQDMGHLDGPSMLPTPNHCH